jgi:Flp pilus assembly protein TadD
MKIKWIHYVLLVSIANSVSAFGQTVGRVGGKVVDAEGNPVKDAQIQIEGMHSKRKYKTKTNGRGQYLHMGVFNNARSRYRVIVRKEGFAPDFMEHVRPTRDGRGGNVDFTLQLGNHQMRMAFQATDEERAAARKAPPPPQTRAKPAGAGLVEIYEAGVAAINAGNFSEAVTLLDRANEIDGAQTAIWSALAKAHEGLRNYDGSLEAYENAAFLEPSVPIYQNMGNIWAAKRNMDKANEYYEKAVALAIETDPTAAGTTYYNMAVTHINSGNFKAAIPALLKAVEADPNHADAHYQLGITLLGTNRIAEAIEYLRKYVELQPSGENAVTAQALVDELG